VVHIFATLFVLAQVPLKYQREIVKHKLDHLSSVTWKSTKKKLHLFRDTELMYLLSTILTYLLLELNPSLRTASSAATQEFPSILWKPKVHYCVYKSPPLISSLSQINSIHTVPSYLSKSHFNIVNLPMP
jgi:hypothetical protein